ncbi:MAG: hypothetical protein WAV56_00445 [Microgenomates group bacterium]
MGLSQSPEVVNSLATGSLPGYLEEVLHSSLGWGDLSCPRVVAEGGVAQKAWMMEIPAGKVYLEWNQERHDWEPAALSKKLENFNLCLRRSETGLDLKWLWPRGKFRSHEVDRVLGRGLKKIIREKGGTEICLLGGIFHLVLGPSEVSITMQVSTGESGGLWSETVPYALAGDLLADVQSFLEGNLGKSVF